MSRRGDAHRGVGHLELDSLEYGGQSSRCLSNAEAVGALRLADLVDLVDAVRGSWHLASTR